MNYIPYPRPGSYYGTSETPWEEHQRRQQRQQEKLMEASRMGGDYIPNPSSIPWGTSTRGIYPCLRQDCIPSGEARKQKLLLLT